MHANSTVFDAPSKSGKFSGQGSEKSHCDSFKGTFSILEHGHLTAHHYKECCEKRGLDPQWVLANVKSYSANEASQYLGYTAKSDGMWIEGYNHQAQFKPDRPWKAEGEKGKAPKYRSGLGEYDAIMPAHPSNPHYWSDIEALKQQAYHIDGVPYIVSTEGGFKAISGCSQGIPTIGALGVEMGLTSAKADPQGKRYLVPALEYIAENGIGVIIANDADCHQNENVIKAERKLAHQLKRFPIPVRIATGLWSVEQGKGMDDYIQMNGAEQFKREVLGKSVPFEVWEKQFQQPEAGDAKPSKIPPADLVGREITEEYRDRWIYNDEHKTWMEYGAERKGIWAPVSDLYIESCIDKILESKGIIGYGSVRYVTNVAAKMRLHLYEKIWGERSPSEIMPFTDGVLDIASGRFEQHSPGNRLTWCLPRPYSCISVGWDSIDKWLTEATALNEQDRELLLCFAAATLRGRSDLQKFLHLIGVGGTGKSSYMRLLESLVGHENIWSGDLKDLEDKHEVARLIGKRLVLLPDQDKVSSRLSNFKRLTGQDSLSGRKLFKDGVNFRYGGTVAVTSNGPIFHTDGGSWLTRRCLALAFNFKPSSASVRDLEAEFEPELSAFTNYLLSIPNEEITRVLRRLGTDGVNDVLWQSKIRTDSIAAWVNDWVIYQLDNVTRIGSDRDEWAKGDYDALISTLYGSYCHYCRSSGLQPKSKNNFSSDLMELCRQSLGWDISYHRNGQGTRFIRGLRLRADGDTTPIVEDILALRQPSADSLTTLRQPSDNLSDNLKPAIYKGSDNPDNLEALNLFGNELENSIQNPKNSQETGLSFDDQLSLLPETTEYQASEVVREVVRESAEGCQRVSDDLAQSDDSEVRPAKPTRADLLAALLACQTWVQVMDELDRAAVKLKKEKGEVFDVLLAEMNAGQVQWFVEMAAAYVRKHPATASDALNWLSATKKSKAFKNKVWSVASGLK